MDEVRIIARYLPQFHSTPDNDAWWGKGFTDWKAVKGADSLFEGHLQPRIPKDGRYYNLLDKDTMQWQASIAKEYGVDGFAFYHYWFENGRRTLEKPAENLLRWTDIDMPFCFSWANESWARTWTKIQNAMSWSDLEEPDTRDNNNRGILLNQRYGDRQDWTEHIDYMIPFFQDRRYITLDERPVLIIYKPDDIACLPEMVEVWNAELKKNDIPALYIIGETFHEEPLSKTIDAVMVRFPTYGIDLTTPEYHQGVRCYDYDYMWDTLLQTDWDRYSQRKVYLCPFVDYDTSPRKGVTGDVITGFSMDKWKKNIRDVIALSQKRNNDFLFINAWNEWGETMYLEPDERNGYGCLEAIRDAKKCISDGTVEDNCNEPQIREDGILRKEYGFSKRHRARLQREMVLQKWMTLRDEGVGLDAWLKTGGYKQVAIYGAGIMGRHLMEELLKSEFVEVKYFIDQNPGKKGFSIPVVSPSGDMDAVDCIISTVTGVYEEIRDNLKRVTDVPIVSLDYIIGEL